MNHLVKHTQRIYKKSVYFLGVIIVIALMGCAPNNFEFTAAPSKSGDPSDGDSNNPDNPNGPSGPGGPGTINETLKTLQPALAVRGIACLMCHADVRANIITDFGYGHAAYLGANARLDGDVSWFNNIATTWQSARQIQGSVFVPAVPITRTAQNALGAAYANVPLISLAQLMTTDYNVIWNYDSDPLVTRSSMALKVQPPAGQAKVIEKATVIIRAPTETEISNLAPALATVASGFQRINSASAVELLTMGAYTQNDSTRTLECSKSDIVVKGTLLLRDLNINASGGCRLYVTGSVFIEGRINYIGAGADQNIQISSANAIVMGINTNHLNNRLLVDHRNPTITGPRTYMQRAQQTMTEARAIGNLRDALDDYGGVRASFDYNGILLNAPMVHSRYFGQVNGTIIAETALFALGQFHFAFDQVFTRVNVLPLLRAPVLLVK